MCPSIREFLPVTFFKKGLRLSLSKSRREFTPTVRSRSFRSPRLYDVGSTQAAVQEQGTFKGTPLAEKKKKLDVQINSFCLPFPSVAEERNKTIT